ncbi:MAG: hypothetical protein ACFE94_00085 [Candidatus Hodarchaeota archaeon]
MTNFNKRGNNDLDSYTVLFYEIDSAVIYVIKNPEEFYQKEIKYPSDLNITFIENFIIYEFKLGDDKFSKVLIHNTSFLNCFFYNMTPQIYLLNVSYAFSYIIVDFINLH